jgi:branched-subunit amino acid aminotransferase/4-amino-4-deoxychorismate lyase
MRDICSFNGTIVPEAQATLPLSQLEIQYGFGVYETLKLRNGILYFLPQHVDRLLHSARLIGLEHQCTSSLLAQYCLEFIRQLDALSANIKVVLYGGSSVKESKLFITASAPMYPLRSWYRIGVTMQTAVYERWMPQAKTLHMLASYYIYKQVKKQGHYDGLLLRPDGQILEGTRTNVYVIKDTTIISPPKESILEGVTQLTMKKVLKENGYTFLYKKFFVKDLAQYDGMFLTSTSTKILPVRKVNGQKIDVPKVLFEVMKLYDDALDRSRGVFSLL